MRVTFALKVKHILKHCMSWGLKNTAYHDTTGYCKLRRASIVIVSFSKEKRKILSSPPPNPLFINDLERCDVTTKKQTNFGLDTIQRAQNWRCSVMAPFPAVRSKSQSLPWAGKCWRVARENGEGENGEGLHLIPRRFGLSVNRMDFWCWSPCHS